ncbi:MAG: hypothetical protein ACOCUL_01590 [Bacteroidota bacterium]
MHFKNTFEDIKYQVKEIEVLIKEMEVKEYVSQIEIDLAMEKLREMYDLFLYMKKSMSIPGLPHEKEQPNDIMDDGQEKIEQNCIDNELPSDIKPEQEDEADHNFPLPKKTDEKSETQILSNQTMNENSNKHKSSTLGEKLISRTNSINESLKRNKQSDISTRLKSKKINDLFSAIGINDKFLFQKELFNSNKGKYEEAINFLNTAESLENAFQFIDSNYQWDMESEAAQKFMEIIKRKFI